MVVLTTTHATILEVTASQLVFQVQVELPEPTDYASPDPDTLLDLVKFDSFPLKIDSLNIDEDNIIEHDYQSLHRDRTPSSNNILDVQ